MFLSVSKLVLVDAARNTSPGGDGLRSDFFPSGSSVKLMRRLSACLCEIEAEFVCLSNQKKKDSREDGGKFVS